MIHVSFINFLPLVKVTHSTSLLTSSFKLAICCYSFSGEIFLILYLNIFFSLVIQNIDEFLGFNEGIVTNKFTRFKESLIPFNIYSVKHLNIMFQGLKYQPIHNPFYWNRGVYYTLNILFKMFLFLLSFLFQLFILIFYLFCTSNHSMF